MYLPKNIRHYFLSISILLLSGITATAQTEPHSWSGIWSVDYKPWPHIPPITMTLHIADPVNDMLYPTKMQLSYYDFKAEYDLLLVKKNDDELAIGRNKVPLSEKPYGLGP